MALFLEPPLAFVLGLAMFPQRRWERWLAIGCTLLFLSALVLTLSRAAYIATAILAVWVVFSLPGRRQKVWGLAATALISLAVVELPFIGLRLGTAAHSAALRLSIYGEALRMLAQRPILGAGISGFPIRVAPFRPSYEDVELYPHNLWLTTWSEIGLLGVIAFGIVFFGLLFRGARASWQSNGLYRAVIWGSTGALVLYLVLSGIWVWILSFTAISQAYLFAILSVALVPLLGFVIFSEPVSTRLVIGLLIILAGLFVVAG